MTALTARIPRDVVVVSGADAFSFLQSLVSQDLESVAEGEGAHTLLLTPQGKLDVDFVLLRVGAAAWLVCEGGFGEQLAASLSRFKIRVDVEIEHRTGATALAVRGDAGLELGAAPYAHAEYEGARLIRIPWPAGSAIDVVGDLEPVAALERRLTAAGAQSVSDAAYDALRIEAGIPRQGVDTDAKTIPQEAFLERDAVSFTKGCFLGQELVCRIDTRGHVNRYLRRVRVGDDTRPPRGSEIVVADKVVGTITSTVEDAALPPAALGYVRRELDPPVEVRVRWDGGESAAVVEELPTAAD